MGKRELLIIIAFVAIGVVAFEVTAPPAKEGQGFSFSRLWQNARRGVRGNAAMASATLNGDIPLGAGLTEVRIAGANRGVRVVGEDRTSIVYELHVESSGPDEATALSYAKRASLKQDDLGSSLSLTVVYPREAQQWGALMLRVPARLAVRIDGGNSADVAGVGAADLEGVSGSVSIRNVAGAVTGAQRSGDLGVSAVGAVNMTLTNSRAKFSQVARTLALTLRNCRCEISQTPGLIDITQSGDGQTRILSPTGAVHVTGTGGSVTIDNPRQETKVDMRQTEVEVTLRAAVPLTLLTTDETLRLLLDGPPAVAIDAVASEGGKITADDFSVTPKHDDQEQRLSQTFGAASAPRVTLRTLRGDIVLGKVK